MTDEKKKDEMRRVVFKTLSSFTFNGSHGRSMTSDQALAPVELKAGACYGDAIKAVVDRCDTIDATMWHEFRMLVNRKTVGHKIPLTAALTELETTMYVVWAMATQMETLRMPYYAWKNGLPWPPAKNWYGDEPFTATKVGEYDDGHRCAHCAHATGEYEHDHDNNINRLVVLAYGDKTELRVAYQIYALLKWLAEESKKGYEAELRDPVLRIVIGKPSALVDKISEQIGKVMGAGCRVDSPWIIEVNKL